MGKKVKKDFVLKDLLEGDNKKYVLLFDSTRDIKNFASNVIDELRAEPKIISNNMKYRVKQNMVQVDDNVVYLGLKQDETLLLDNYSEEQIIYYEERED